MTDGSPPEEVFSGVFAVERHGGGPVTLDLRGESGGVEAVLRQFLIAAPFRLAQVSEAETIVEHLRVFGRLQKARCQSDKMQRRPEPVAGSGVIGARLLGRPARSGAAENKVETGSENVGQDHGNWIRGVEDQRVED